MFVESKRVQITVFNPIFFTFEHKRNTFPAMNNNQKAKDLNFIRQGDFVKNGANIMFTGVYAYKLRERLTWPEISDIMAKKGHKYNINGLSHISGNWSSNYISYYFNLYEVLGIPWPTPKLLVEWEEEIKVLQAERKERISRQKAEKAERIARNKIQ